MSTRLIFVGGFLGAGKTTLLLRAAAMLAEQGRRVGLVTNDQSSNLVDTALASDQALPRVEVAGGCFCCRFPNLLASIRELQASAAPDIILAEPVGSCTDLAATVLRPLATYHPGQFQLAPLTILLDPLRQPERFPNVVDYLYQKQLAEANLIVLNKRDRIEPALARQHIQRLQARHPDAEILSLSARTGEGLSKWLVHCLTGASALDQALELDYPRYAEAEACLGWLNATGTLAAEEPFAPAEWLATTLGALEQRFADQHAEIAHVKLHLRTPGGALKASLTQHGSPISWDMRADGSPTDSARFILNARVNTDPRTLETIVRQTLAQVGVAQPLRSELTFLECFSPQPPQPTYRLLRA
ncbi:MAG TPA: GTP-binding protein [Roseiflexaceae bacterium]|nr:GTP-binding protein [Roseiflexaceae bacterium]